MEAGAAAMAVTLSPGDEDRLSAYVVVKHLPGLRVYEVSFNTIAAGLAGAAAAGAGATVRVPTLFVRPLAGPGLYLPSHGDTLLGVVQSKLHDTVRAPEGAGPGRLIGHLQPQQPAALPGPRQFQARLPGTSEAATGAATTAP